MTDYVALVEASTDELEQLCVSDDGWEHPKEKKGVKIHMRSVEGTAIVMLRGVTTIPNTAEEVLAATEDLSKRKEWDELFIEGSVVEQIDADHQVLQFKFKAPSRMVYPRDFVMSRGIRRKEDGTIISNHIACEHPKAGEVKGYVRGQLRASGYHIKPNDGGGCTVTYVVQVDPKGWIPTMVVNTVAVKQPLEIGRAHV